LHIKCAIVELVKNTSSISKQSLEVPLPQGEGSQKSYLYAYKQKFIFQKVNAVALPFLPAFL
jgi:hypothetical protein